MPALDDPTLQLIVDIVASKPLRAVFVSSLILGNFLNHNTSMGAARGFELASLENIANMKAAKWATRSSCSP